MCVVCAVCACCHGNRLVVFLALNYSYNRVRSHAIRWRHNNGGDWSTYCPFNGWPRVWAGKALNLIYKYPLTLPWGFMLLLRSYRCSAHNFSHVVIRSLFPFTCRICIFRKRKCPMLTESLGLQLLPPDMKRAKTPAFPDPPDHSAIIPQASPHHHN